MGLFTKKTEEEKALQKEKKQATLDKLTAFSGFSMQPIGKIPQGDPVGLKLDPVNKVLKLHSGKIDITLPYDRIQSFKVEDETNLVKSGSTIGRALVGGALFGKTGAVVGGMSAKGNTKTKWIATLTYEDKEGAIQELGFIEMGGLNYYDGSTKSYSSSQFEKRLNAIVSEYREDITEL